MTKPLRDKDGKFIAKSIKAKNATPVKKIVNEVPLHDKTIQLLEHIGCTSHKSSVTKKPTPVKTEFTVCPQCGKGGLVDVNSNIMGQNAYKTNKTIKMCKQCGLRIAV